MPWANPIGTARRLRERGVLGINGRNSRFTLAWNRRRDYPLVDDKLQTKELCEKAGIPVPRLLAVARHQFEIHDFLTTLREHETFVVKPSRGAMGNGILVIVGRDGEHLLRPGRRRIDEREVHYHASSIISGLYALGGHDDFALAEERLVVHPTLFEIAGEGVPDIRIVVFRGIPVMAMMRLPTARSGGRANLHQGAIGTGVDLDSGATTHAILGSRPIERHPDSDLPLVGVPVPEFDRVLEIAVQASDQVPLGYVGADVVVDANRGPEILELNARPGLMIQMANRLGLAPRLDEILAMPPATLSGSLEERIAAGRALARRHRP